MKQVKTIWNTFIFDSLFLNIIFLDSYTSPKLDMHCICCTRYYILYGNSNTDYQFLEQSFLTVFFLMISTYPVFNTYLWKTVLFLNNSPIYTARDVNAENVQQTKYKP